MTEGLEARFHVPGEDLSQLYVFLGVCDWHSRQGVPFQWRARVGEAGLGPFPSEDRAAMISRIGAWLNGGAPVTLWIVLLRDVE